MKQRKIFLFWLPLFASWLLMTAEGPTISAVINRLPNEELMLAAQGIVLTLSVTIESPIINLLSTSTALVRDRRTYNLLRQFTIHWMIGLTVVTMLIGFTPLFDVVVIDLMAVPLDVAAWVRPGMQIMTFWSAAIAWRRFLQGVLIHFDQTRKVAWGTAVRLVSSGGTAISLFFLGDLPGVYIGATALMAGVIAEAIYATVAVRPLFQHQLAPDTIAEVDEEDEDEDEEPLTYRSLFEFHLPLAATSVLILLVQPLVAFSLARLERPTQSLAAWPMVFQIMLMSRATAFALPETVIALTKGEKTFRPLRRFTYVLFAANTLVMILFVFTPLARFYLRGVQDATPAVTELALAGLALFVPLPGLTILVSWVRGLLIKRRATQVVNAGMVVNLVVTVIVLAVGLQMRTPGIPTAAVALTLAIAVEFLFLYWRVRDKLGFRFTLFDRPIPVPIQGD